MGGPDLRRHILMLGLLGAVVTLTPRPASAGDEPTIKRYSDLKAVNADTVQCWHFSTVRMAGQPVDGGKEGVFVVIQVGMTIVDIKYHSVTNNVNN